MIPITHDTATKDISSEKKEDDQPPAVNGRPRGTLNPTHSLTHSLMDDLKLYDKELESLVHTVRVFSEDTGMQFGIANCAVIRMQRGKLKEATTLLYQMRK